MDENLYAPPKAAVADVAPATDAGVRFFSASPVKLVVMSVCTLGLYQIYWFYKQWVLIKQHSEPDIIPWARAFFGIIWCYSCLEFIRKDDEHLDVAPALPSVPLTVGWIAASLAWRLPEPYFLIGMLSPLLLVPAQQHINHINAMVAPDHDKNTRFSAWNWLAVAVGALFVGLIILGLTKQPLPRS